MTEEEVKKLVQETVKATVLACMGPGAGMEPGMGQWLFDQRSGGGTPGQWLFDQKGGQWLFDLLRNGQWLFDLMRRSPGGGTPGQWLFDQKPGQWLFDSLLGSVVRQAMEAGKSGPSLWEEISKQISDLTARLAEGGK